MKQVFSLFFSLLALFTRSPDLHTAYINMPRETVVLEAAAPDGGHVTDDSLEECVEVLAHRINSSSYGNVRIKAEDGRIAITSTSNGDIAPRIREFLSDHSVVFCDPDGNPVIDETGISGARADSIEDSDGKTVHYVTIQFTDEGRAAFADLSEAAAARTDGNNCIPIMIDGEIISMPKVAERVDTWNIELSGDFDYESAKQLAAYFSWGRLPLILTPVQ